jgi:hypothetical protein
MANAPIVKVLGLRALRRDIIRLDKQNAPAAFVRAGQAVAEPVAARIRARLPSRSGALRGTVRVAKVRTGATIRVGGIRHVNYPGQHDFGGYPAGRAYLPGGRNIFPAAVGMAPQVISQYESELQKAINEIPWETNPQSE